MYNTSVSGNRLQKPHVSLHMVCGEALLSETLQVVGLVLPVSLAVFLVIRILGVFVKHSV